MICVYILIFLMCAFIYNVYLYYRFTNEKPIISLKSIFFTVLSSLLLMILNLTDQSMLMTFGNLLCTAIIINSFYKISFSKTVYYSIVIWVLTIIADIIVSLFVTTKGLNYDIVIDEYLFRCLLLIPVIFIEYLITCIKRFRRYINSFYNKYGYKIDNSIIIKAFIVAFIYIFLILFYLNLYKSTSKAIYYSSFLVIIIIVVLIMVLFKYAIKAYELSILNKGILKENKTIKQIAMQDQEFKHNVINNLMGIKTVSNKKTNKLIDELICSYQTEYKTITNINDLPTGIQSMIYIKAYEENVDDLNLIVDNSIKGELYDMLSPKNYNNLCTSVGILFDNALQAVKDVDEKIISIDFEEDDDSIYITIKNTFSNIIDVDNVGNISYTTKKSGHGIGLNYIHKLKPLKFSTAVFNNIFISKLEIKKSKKI